MERGRTATTNTPRFVEPAVGVAVDLVVDLAVAPVPVAVPVCVPPRRMDCTASASSGVLTVTVDETLPTENSGAPVAPANDRTVATI